MLIDAQTIPNGETIDTEICIVGSGPAGMSLAQELVGQSFRVCLLESGSLETNETVQTLAGGETEGDPYSALDILRRRQCGGTANDWTVQMTPTQRGVRYAVLDEVDFEQRDWLPYSGWCFDRSYLDPYYERAQAICQAGRFAYDGEDWATADMPLIPFQGDRVYTTMFQFGPSAAFTRTCRDRVVESTNATLYLNANVVELETDDTAQTVTRVRSRCLSGNEFYIKARIVILATGGLENARLLLLSDRVQKNGLGNEHDLVGRFFMDHPLVRTGEFFPNDRTLFNRTALYDKLYIGNTLVMAKLALTNEVMRREQVMNLSALLYPRYPLNDSRATQSLKGVIKALAKGKVPQNLAQELRTITTGTGDIAAALYRNTLVKPFRPEIPADLSQGGWSYWTNKERKFGYFEVFSQSEQAPHPDNRVTLSKQLDRLGCRQTKVHWQWREFDREHVRRAQEILAAEISASGLGYLRLDREDEGARLFTPTTHHHMGTTRMHPDPKQGVVDENCKVHSVSNLFIAGSSVFPTGGYANPTLTIVALATRLADHVKQTMAAPSVNLPTLSDAVS